MTRRIKTLLIPACIAGMISCNSNGKDTYAIKDFRKSIQPLLSKIVTEGIVTWHDSALISQITDEELKRLGNSEIPVLRATAYQEMSGREGFDDFELVMSRLDDTAIVPVDGGEFGLSLKTVSDYIIECTTWETAQQREKTIEAVLSRHNYLRSAYTILIQLKPKEKYYSFIRDMAMRPRRLDPLQGYELGFDEIEYALYGLAKFRKQQDIRPIRDILMKHVWKMSDISFRLLKEFPDSAYMDVLEEYHRRQFYRFSGIRPHGFTGIAADRAAPEDFVEALVIQQSTRSARLLDTMLTGLRQFTCMPGRDEIISAIMMQVWDHPCPAYTALREKIRPRVQQKLKRQIFIEMDTNPLPPDTTKRKIWWWS